ncbi:MAG: hypothetical protein LBL58_02680 [Tannerellaceae bacterium]|jgi:hypothetical protein|nr:hypothetical protein [Tannerellaceae bacterium]
MINDQTTSLPSLSVTLPLEEYQGLLDRLCLIEPLEQKISEYRREADRSRWYIAFLERLCWGRSSEKRRLPEDPAQLSICFEEVPLQADTETEKEKAAEETEKTEVVYSRFRKRFREKKVSHARKPIPENIPRIKTVLEPEADLMGAVRMGEEITERYAVQPRMLYVEQLVRPRYKLADGGIAIAPLPVTAHPRSNATHRIVYFIDYQYRIIIF